MDRVVIVPVFNQLNLVRKCIQSVISNTPDLKLIIIDDASTDLATSDWLRLNREVLGYHLIRHEQSLNFSKSANDGIDYALENYRFKCLCVLNSDTVVVTEDWYERIELDITERENIGVAGVMSNNAGFQSVDNFYLSKIRKFKGNLVVECDVIHGFCFFLSLNLLKKIRHYDHTTFPSYASDLDFCLKALRIGFKNIVDGGVYVEHFGKASGMIRVSEHQSSKAIFDKKWGQT